MVTENEAREIALKNMPQGSQFIKSVSFGNLFVLQINGPDPLEGNLDPFFSVDKTTGYFVDFSIVNGGPDLLKQFVG